jgi:hypothetical protein
MWLLPTDINKVDFIFTCVTISVKSCKAEYMSSLYYYQENMVSGICYTT